MAAKGSKTKMGRIPAAELRSFSLWSLPRMEGAQQDRASPFAHKKSLAGAAAQEEEAGPIPGLTVKALEKLREEARDEGFAQGLEEGRAKGEEAGVQAGREAGYKAAYGEAQQEIEALEVRLQSFLSHLEAPLENQEAELQEALLTLVAAVSRAAVGVELRLRPELLEEAVERALQVLPAQPGLTLSVNPRDEALLLSLKERKGGSWTLRADAGIEPGGLQVLGQDSYLDFTLESRFQAAFATLQKRALSAAEEKPSAPDAG